MKTARHATRGFTMIELVIVAVIIGIMAAALVPLTISSLRAYRETVDDVAVLDKLRYATERLAREIREIDYDATQGFDFIHPTTGAVYSAGGMGPNSMKFKRRFYDAAGVASTGNVTIGNTGDSVTLAYSTVAVGAQVLTDELGGTAPTESTNLAFSYLKEDGTAAGVTDVRSVVISLTLRHNSNDYTQRTRVELKNRS